MPWSRFFMASNMSFNAVRENEIIAKFQKLHDCDISTKKQQQKNNNSYPKFLITSIRNKNSYALLFSCPEQIQMLCTNSFNTSCLK